MSLFSGPVAAAGGADGGGAATLPVRDMSCGVSSCYVPSSLLLIVLESRAVAHKLVPVPGPTVSLIGVPCSGLIAC